MYTQQAFVLLVVGDEIISGKRQDKHLSHVLKTLDSHNMQLNSVHYVGDELVALIRHLLQSREHRLPVLCFGGIGATPDDNTRAAASLAFSRPLQRHPDAARLIKRQFGGGSVSKTYSDGGPAGRGNADTKPGKQYSRVFSGTAFLFSRFSENGLANA